MIDDLIRGRVEVDWAREQDHVIQRADGTCLYHLANVVDDYDFEITHVIRAEEHLSNTPRQVFIIQSLGYPRAALRPSALRGRAGQQEQAEQAEAGQVPEEPRFRRSWSSTAGRFWPPLGRTPSTRTASTRSWSISTSSVGYLPEAIINYLALLGWSLDDKTEHFTRQELIETFSLERVNKAPASFDPEETLGVPGSALPAAFAERKAALAMPFLQTAGLLPSPAPPEAESKLARFSRPRAIGSKWPATCWPMPISSSCADDQFPYDEKAFDKRVRAPGAAELLAKFRPSLAHLEDFRAHANWKSCCTILSPRKGWLSAKSFTPFAWPSRARRSDRGCSTAWRSWERPLACADSIGHWDDLTEPEPLANRPKSPIIDRGNPLSALP